MFIPTYVTRFVAEYSRPWYERVPSRRRRLRFYWVVVFRLFQRRWSRVLSDPPARCCRTRGRSVTRSGWAPSRGTPPGSRSAPASPQASPWPAAPSSPSRYRQMFGLVFGCPEGGPLTPPPHPPPPPRARTLSILTPLCLRGGRVESSSSSPRGPHAPPLWLFGVCKKPPLLTPLLPLHHNNTD